MVHANTIFHSHACSCCCHLCSCCCGSMVPQRVMSHPAASCHVALSEFRIAMPLIPCHYGSSAPCDSVLVLRSAALLALARLRCKPAPSMPYHAM